MPPCCCNGKKCKFGSIDSPTFKSTLYVTLEVAGTVCDDYFPVEIPVQWRQHPSLPDGFGEWAGYSACFPIRSYTPYGLLTTQVYDNYQRFGAHVCCADIGGNPTLLVTVYLLIYSELRWQAFINPPPFPTGSPDPCPSDVSLWPTIPYGPPTTFVPGADKDRLISAAMDASDTDPFLLSQTGVSMDFYDPCCALGGGEYWRTRDDIAIPSPCNSNPNPCESSRDFVYGQGTPGGALVRCLVTSATDITLTLSD